MYKLIYYFKKVSYILFFLKIIIKKGNFDKSIVKNQKRLIENNITIKVSKLMS